MDFIFSGTVRNAKESKQFARIRVKWEVIINFPYFLIFLFYNGMGMMGS